jgi:hypothetical protein
MLDDYHAVRRELDLVAGMGYHEHGLEPLKLRANTSRSVVSTSSNILSDAVV